MAGADFGYVGAAQGKVTLYEGVEPVRKNIPQEDALDALENLIKERGLWRG
jgi:(E)-4-hydroxy-3-methylbut-2-enyl-diphosphate synthase